jgi:hypothetical protein
MDVHFVSDEAIEQHPVGELASEQRCDRWRSGVVTWAHSTAAAELHGDYCGGAGRAGGHLPPGRRAPPPGERPGGAEPYSCLTLGRYSPTYLAWAALQLPGVEVEEVPM